MWCTCVQISQTLKKQKKRTMGKDSAIFLWSNDSLRHSSQKRYLALREVESSYRKIFIQSFQIGIYRWNFEKGVSLPQDFADDISFTGRFSLKTFNLISILIEGFRITYLLILRSSSCGYLYRRFTTEVLILGRRMRQQTIRVFQRDRASHQKQIGGLNLSFV